MISNSSVSIVAIIEIISVTVAVIILIEYGMLDYVFGIFINLANVIVVLWGVRKHHKNDRGGKRVLVAP